jgi:SAM-dependent methyltransferase
MALDYRQSNFTAIDICDLLPADFEKNMMSETQEQINVPRTMFTPQHPNLPPHLNTTSDVTTSTESSSFDDSSCSSTTYSAHSSTKTNQPHRQLLPNLDFYKFNPLECRLPFEDNHFDFIMQRMVTTAYSQEDWKHILPELLRVTKPGGYIQLVEVDYYTIDLGPKGKAWETSGKFVDYTRQQ